MADDPKVIGPLSYRIHHLERQMAEAYRTIEALEWANINRPGYGLTEESSGFKGGSFKRSPRLRISRKLRITKK